jgi:hypothetical protein
VTYAKETRVPVERTRNEIEQLLKKHGADQFGFGWEGHNVAIAFRMKTRHVRIRMDLSKKGRPTGPQTERSCWRCLLLVIKAKLEAVGQGITTFDEEFLAHILMPGNQTVSQIALPEIDKAYKTGKLPSLMLGGAV